MYDELVNQLRHPWQYNGLIADLTNSAADAIEELIRVADAIPHVCECCIGCEVETGGCDRAFVLSPKRAREYLSKPSWIPVAEGLPKTRESILGKKSSKVIVAFRFDDGTQGTDTAHTLNGEWVFEDHITVVARTITHWQPLPEPPKEEL